MNHNQTPVRLEKRVSRSQKNISPLSRSSRDSSATLPADLVLLISA
jgi:hypothetical protein